MIKWSNQKSGKFLYTLVVCKDKSEEEEEEEED